MIEKVFEIIFLCCLVNSLLYSMDSSKEPCIPCLKEISFKQVVSQFSEVLNLSTARNLHETYIYLQDRIVSLPQKLADDVMSSFSKQYGLPLYPWKTRCLKSYSQGSSAIRALCFSRCGRYLAFGSEHNVVVWDLMEYKCIRQLMIEGLLKKLAFLSGCRLAILYDQSPIAKIIDFFDILSGSKYKRILGPDDFFPRYDTIAFSQNGQSMARGQKNDVVLYTCEENSEALKTLFNLQDYHVSGKDSWHQCDKFPDEIILAPFGTSLKGASAWCIEKACLQTVLSGHSDDVVAVAYDHNTKYIASAACDKTLRLWDIAKQKQVAVIPFSSIVRAIMFSPDELSFACGCEDGIIHVCTVFDTLLHMVCKAALYNELHRGDRNYLEVLYNHVLLDKCDVTLRKHIRSINAMKLNDVLRK